MIHWEFDDPSFVIGWLTKNMHLLMPFQSQLALCICLISPKSTSGVTAVWCTWQPSVSSYFYQVKSFGLMVIFLCAYVKPAIILLPLYFRFKHRHLTQWPPFPMQCAIWRHCPLIVTIFETLTPRCSPAPFGSWCKISSIADKRFGHNPLLAQPTYIRAYLHTTLRPLQYT
jgi:hypothetical protein